ncbi:helix-turn-helix transcriptional regulator [Streptomyces sp. DSM 41982]|uniref:Helix-turn-helix transcriptional regulator n=1 Tax=Streptomyces evansiae TaxID=3075535 RepID=A0ABD5EA06_9ACTN|nr:MULTISPECIES: helix-turn-helix transcriptional regulator [unclassified Streptomyces]MDT0417881.1 helix-turn-helix transcriptional regulator [Streptomyces sp. DSM 41982]SCD69119.1 Helix-turn-helix domain-containing protein [Streptomyces sp. SolWspMP-sol7th]
MSDPAANDLRAFLRTRRARISPQDAGLPASMGVRRVPGLRREEVALLAGVSAEYYERLERGRTKNVSAAVLDAVARVLRLDPAERDHLFALAGPARARSAAAPVPRLRPGLRRALDLMADMPALVLGPRHDLVAVNPLGAAFYTGLDSLPPGQRNMVRYLFTVDAARELYEDWATTARKIVAELRRYAGAHPHDPGLADLVGDLAVRDPDFRRWWAEHDVYLREYGSKCYHHPVVGPMELGYEAFTPVGQPELVLGMHTVEPHSPSAEALALLADRATAGSGEGPTGDGAAHAAPDPGTS